MNEMTPIQKLTKDLANAAKTMSDEEARFLVDNFYNMQDGRIRADGQIRSINQTPAEIIETDDGVIPVHEPHEVLTWLSEQSASMEDQILRALEKYVNAHVMGPWMMSIFGIGPVISAGLLAHIDVEWMECSVCQKKETAAKKCKCGAPYVRKTLATAGQVWRYAGLDPTTQWEKKTKRPWNAELKVLCWKAGESFWKFHKKPKCFYGHIFAKQKLVYADRNEAGDYADRSATILTEKKFKKDTDAYKAYSVGKFPPAHIHAMARRYAVKQFLSDLHAVWHFVEFGALAPKPWIIEEGGHAHFREPQNIGIVQGLREAYAGLKP